MPAFRLAALLAAAFFVLPLTAPAEDTAEPLLERNGIRIEAGTARAMSAAAPSGAGYFRLTNTTAGDDRLIEVRSAAAERVELHAHELRDGVARMLHLEEGVEIPAGESLEFAQGGLHVMFMGLSDAWSEGAAIPLTLIFEQAGEIAVELPVVLGMPRTHAHDG